MKKNTNGIGLPFNPSKANGEEEENLTERERFFKHLIAVKERTIKHYQKCLMKEKATKRTEKYLSFLAGLIVGIVLTLIAIA